MADLAKTRTPVGARSRGTENRDFILPSRRETRAPDLEVNAPLTSPNQSEAQKLASILGVAEDAGAAAVNVARVQDARNRDEVRTQATADAQLGAPSDQLNRSQVYTQAFFAAEGARQAADLDATLTQAINDRLANTDDPATPDDIEGLIDQHFRGVMFNEDGTLQPMHPAKQRALAVQMAETRARIAGPALKAITDQTNTRFAENFAFELVRNGVPELGYQEPEVPTPRLPTAIESIDPDVAFAEPEPETRQAVAAVTNRLPIQGTVTATFSRHRQRGSQGLDIDGRIGDPVELPASGRVIDSGFNSRAGNFVIVDHGNGIVTSYSHLDKRHVKVGDTIAAGSILGTVGNTGNVRSRGGGDGSHLHYRVKVNGTDVDPEGFTFDGIDPAAVTAEGGRPAQLDGLISEVPEARVPVLDFEYVMERRPPNMSPKAWKETIIPALILNAEKQGRPEILEGIWQSVRADGTPSFNPAEIDQLRTAAREIQNRQRIDTERRRNEVFETNRNQILDAFTRGEEVSISDLQRLRKDGMLDPQFAYAMVEDIRNEQEAAVREATAEARAQRMEEEADFDALANAEMARLQVGMLTNATPEDLLRRFENGEFGTGNKARARLGRLQAASRAGQSYIESTPTGAYWAQKVRESFPITGGSSSGVLGGILGSDGARNAEAQAFYAEQIAEGKSPAQAFTVTNDRYSRRTGESDVDAELRQIESLLQQ